MILRRVEFNLFNTDGFTRCIQKCGSCLHCFTYLLMMVCFRVSPTNRVPIAKGSCNTETEKSHFCSLLTPFVAELHYSVGIVDNNRPPLPLPVRERVGASTPQCPP